MHPSSRQRYVKRARRTVTTEISKTQTQRRLVLFSAQAQTRTNLKRDEPERPREPHSPPSASGAQMAAHTQKKTREKNGQEPKRRKTRQQDAFRLVPPRPEGPTGRPRGRGWLAGYGHHAHRRSPVDWTRGTRGAVTISPTWLGCAAATRIPKPTRAHASVPVHLSASFRWCSQPSSSSSVGTAPCVPSAHHRLRSFSSLPATLLSFPRRSPPLLHETDSRQRSSPAHQTPEPSAEETRAPAPSPSRRYSEVIILSRTLQGLMLLCGCSVRFYENWGRAEAGDSGGTSWVHVGRIFQLSVCAG